MDNAYAVISLIKGWHNAHTSLNLVDVLALDHEAALRARLSMLSSHYVVNGSFVVVGPSGIAKLFTVTTRFNGSYSVQEDMV